MRLDAALQSSNKNTTTSAHTSQQHSCVESTVGTKSLRFSYEHPRGNLSLNMVSVRNRSKRIPHLALVIPFQALTGVLEGGAQFMRMSYQWFNAHQIEGRDTEKDVCACMFRGELSIYNSRLCLRLQRERDGCAFSLLKIRCFFCFLFFSNLAFLRATSGTNPATKRPFTILWYSARRTAALGTSTHGDKDTHHKVKLTLLHKDNWQLVPPFNIKAQQATYSNTPFQPSHSTFHG